MNSLVLLPFANAYALPGHRVVAGEYPFEKDPGQARKKISRCLDAGITWFIDLTVQGEAALVPYEPILMDEAAARGLDVHYTRLSIPDNGVPHPDRMREILDVLDRATAEGGTAYVHCWGGIGRTGTTVGCYLVRHGLSGEQALARVQALFRTMSPAKVKGHAEGSPQTDPQRKFVRSWSEPAPKGLSNSPSAAQPIHPVVLPHPVPRSIRLEDSRIWVGPHPLSAGIEGAVSLRRLLESGIDCFLDLLPAHELSSYAADLTTLAASMGKTVSYVAVPVPEAVGSGRKKALLSALETLDRLRSEGHAIYIHAKGIGGRLSVFLACDLVRSGWSAREAFEEVGKIGDSIAAASGIATTPLSASWRSLVEVLEVPDEIRVLNPSPRPRFLRDQMRGALIGLAVGDALGTTVEFRPPGSFAPVTDMIGGGPFHLEAGEWTDDTSMALCLAESLIEKRKFDARDQMERYVRWRAVGHLSSNGECFDCGNTVRASLDRFQKSGDPFSGSTDPQTAGNGSLMRLAPVPIFFFDDAQLLDRCADMSRTTHGARVAIDACRYLGALIAGALQGRTKGELLAPRFSPIPGAWEEEPLDPIIAAIADGSYQRKNPPQIRGSGYAADALEAALWAFYTTSDFRSGVLRAVNLGNDADTTAAIHGQLAGAFYGESGIPASWRARLAHADLLSRYAEMLYQLAINPRPALSPARSVQAREMATDAIREHGSAWRALDAILKEREDARREMGVLHHSVNGSMGAAGAEEEALRLLRVQVGLDLATSR